MLSASLSALLPGATLLLYKPDRKYAKAVIMGAVLYPLTVAVFSISACNDFSHLTVPFISDACAQSAAPDQPVTPPAHQDEQNIPQPPQEQSGPKPPEAPPVEPSQPHPGQPSSEQKQPEQEAPKKPAEEQIETTIFDVLHGWTSRSILSSATWLDSFFGDQRYLAEYNQSYIRVRYNVFLEQGSPWLRRPELQIRVVLPQLKERTHLEFAGTPQETTGLTATEAPSAGDPFADAEDRNVTAAVSQLLRDTNRVNFIVRAGLKWHSGGPVVILGPRFRMLFPLNHWNLRFVEEVILRNDNGWAAKTTFDLERPLPHDLFFRATNDWIQADHMRGFIYDFIFSLAHPLSPKKVLEYEWVNIFQTQPVNALTEVALRMRYRQRIWRDWLFFEAAPRDRSFEATPGILFRIEAMFGHYR
jgi:hypothetical protein